MSEIPPVAMPGIGTDNSIIAMAIAIVLVVFYALDKLLPYIKAKGGGYNGKVIHEQLLNEAAKATTALIKLEDRVGRMEHRINDLHEWHNHDEPMQPGQKIWWGKDYDLKPAISGLNKTLKQQTEVLSELCNEMKQLQTTLKTHEAAEEHSLLSIAKSIEKLVDQ